MTETVKALIVCGAVLAVFAAIGACCEWHDRKAKMRRMVWDNLDSAYANGFFEPGEQLHALPAFEVAYDMVTYADDCFNLDPVRLTPYVYAWMQHRGLA